MDKKSGALYVDRVMHTSMRYPCNYGFVPHTLSEDGDPIDILVASPVEFLSASIVRCRPVGVLEMKDEKGADEKILAVPVDALNPYYSEVKQYSDLPKILLDQISHFFAHYKDLESGKWVELEGWEGAEHAAELIEKLLHEHRHNSLVLKVNSFLSPCVQLTIFRKSGSQFFIGNDGLYRLQLITHDVLVFCVDRGIMDH